jgi:hypothetical protein
VACSRAWGRMTRSGHPHVALDSLAVELVEDAPSPLALREVDGGWRVHLASQGIDADAATRWLKRVGNHGARRADAPASTTLALCVDERVEELSRTYATAVGAHLEMVEPGALKGAVERADGVDSVTAFVLADALDETLLHAFWVANRQRMRRHLAPLPFGLMTGMTHAHLAWLLAKTLLWMSRPHPFERVGFADYDGFAGSGVFRTLSGGKRVAPERPLDSGDWRSQATHLAALFTHSVSFDAHLGDTALCGQIADLLALQRSGGAPSCFFDGRCFRVDGSDGAPTQILAAIDASPLLWFLNGCGAVPLAGSAFGVRTGYAYGLLAGAALGVLGAHITQVTSRWRNVLYGGLLATGATTGQAALALSQLAEDGGGFYTYSLLGSPDLRLTDEQPLEPSACHGRIARFEPRARSRWACRLALPEAFSRAPVTLGDDGGAPWQGATWQALELGACQSVLLVLEPPRDLDGWIELGSSRDLDERLASEAQELRRRLGVLRLYEFARAETARIDACETLREQLSEVLAMHTLVRRRTYAAVLLAQLERALDELQAAVCGRFVEHVLRHDFNLDRESHNGFLPGAVTRTRRTCRACGSALFAAADRWSEDPCYLRTKHICANCFGISMTLDTSSVRVAPLRLRRPRAGRGVELALRMRNTHKSAQRTWVAAAPRRGAAQSALEPFHVDLAAGASASRTLHFDLGSQPPGTQSLRVIVLAGGAAQFHNFKLSLPTRATPQAGTGR